MDQRLIVIMSKFCSFVFQQTRVEMVRKYEWEGKTLITSLTPKDLTYVHTLGYHLMVELEVKGNTLNYTVVAEGEKLEKFLEKFVTWLKQQQVTSGDGVCARK